MTLIPTSKPRRRRRIAATALAGLALVVTSCSASGGGPESVSSGPGGFPTAEPPALDVGYLNEAAASTQAATTMKIAIETSISGVPGMGDAGFSGTGEVDRGARRAHLAMDLGAAMSKLPGADAGDGTIETVVDGDTVYLKTPFCGCLTGTDKPWLSLSLDDLPDVPAADRPAGAGADPTSALEFLEQAGGTLTEEGTESVRGVETRHVSTVIDVAKLAERLDGERRKAFEDALGGLGGDVRSLLKLPVDAWVDQDGRIRRFSLTVDAGSMADEVPELADASVTVTYELYDFDVPVDIAIPDPSQVAPFDLSKLGGN